MSAEVWPDAQPFSSPGGKIGVLLIHGFTGCTQSLRPLGEALAKEGFTVMAPRLPGHGTSVKDLATKTWQEWTDEAEKAFQRLLERCDRVFIIGLSMGGAIACYLGARYPDKVAGIVPINATVTKLNNPMHPLTPVAKYIMKVAPGEGSDIKDPNTKESCYDKTPVRAAAELLKLMRLTKKYLPEVNVPILVFTSREDHVVRPSNGPYIMENVGSRDKELVWLENSYHVATLDNDKDEIINRTVEFINRLS